MAIERSVWTVGHSNQTAAALVELLRQHRIEVLVDVRSRPRSSFVPHFDREPLQHSLGEVGVRYLFMGDNLGGRPDSAAAYDDDGHVRYDVVAASAPFRSAIERLLTGADEYRVALMCSEEDPTNCHRRLLVARVLEADDTDVLHIRADGNIEREEDLASAQLNLFGEDERAWRSVQSVSPNGRQPGSSEP